MGRELLQRDENEWWIVETHSNIFSRVSKPFESKEEAIETLVKGGCHPRVVKDLEETGCVPSFYGLFNIAAGLEVSKALDKMDAMCPDGDRSLFEEE